MPFFLSPVVECIAPMICHLAGKYHYYDRKLIRSDKNTCSSTASFSMEGEMPKTEILSSNTEEAKASKQNVDILLALCCCTKQQYGVLD